MRAVLSALDKRVVEGTVVRIADQPTTITSGDVNYTVTIRLND